MNLKGLPSKMILGFAWLYIVLFFWCIMFWFYHPAMISENILSYFASANASTKAEEFELTKIYIQSSITFLTTLLFAAGAYILVTENQKKSTRLQLAIEKLNLISELHAEIRGIFDKRAIYDPANRKGTRKPKKLVFSLDGKTTWKANCTREWNHELGERTYPFVETSSTLAPNAEVSINVLHDYMAWMRRVRLGIKFDILEWTDVQLYWRDIVVFASGARFSFMCDVFSREDMSDFAFLVDGLILFEDKENLKNLSRYINNATHRSMLDALSPKSRSIIAHWAARSAGCLDGSVGDTTEAEK